MEANVLHARLYQAFMRGYSMFPDFLSVTAGASAAARPFPAVIDGAALESRELRRSIDACQHALSQMADLPDVEKEQLRSELRATFDHLVDVSDQLLTMLRPADDARAQADPSGFKHPSDSEHPSDLPPSPPVSGKKPPHRR